MGITTARPGPGGGLEQLGIWVLVGGLGAGAALIWASSALATVTVGPEGGRTTLPRNPFSHAIQVLTGRAPWATPEWLALGFILASLALLVGLVLAVRRGRRGPAIDRAAPRLARGRELHALTRAGASAAGGGLASAEIGPGLPIGTAVAGGRELFSSWEDVSVDIWGPRTGKTTSRAVPAILAAPGALIVTSNKRDIVDATRQIRAERGDVWVFDPQQIIGEPAGWWWNPLSYVRDEVQARVLADLFAAGSRQADAKTDAFFDSAGKDLLAGLLLAAAVADRPITDVYEWLCDPGNDEPVELLTGAGHRLVASSVSAAVLAPEKQRAGVYATAQQAVTFLTNQGLRAWITRPLESQIKRPEFSPRRLVLAGQTLYAVSKEGRGSLGPLVAALTVAVTEAAEAVAKESAGGRLAVPMVAVLDEAANVCRWPDLPDLYSHYGSRGIVIMTILQSWSQGVSVWGREGMRKLWSAANIRVFGGGVAEVEFLQEIAALIGEYQRLDRSRSHGKGGVSTSLSLRTEKLLDVADLAAMPRGRALLIPSGARPVLVATRPWMESPEADRVRASIAASDPTAGS